MVSFALTVLLLPLRPSLAMDTYVRLSLPMAIVGRAWNMLNQKQYICVYRSTQMCLIFVYWHMCAHPSMWYDPEASS